MYRWFCAALFVLFLYPTNSTQAAQYVVDRHHPRASDSGIGSAEAPFRTIGAAMLRCQPGDRVTVRRGVYRESVHVPDGQPGRLVTLEAARGERVILKGSDPVTGWEQIGESDVWIRKGWPVEPQMVFVNGHTLLTQLRDDSPFGANLNLASAAADQMPPGSFRYDRDNRTLVVRLPWNRPITWHPVEATVRDTVMTAGKYAHIRGFTVEHNNLSRTGSMAGMVQIGAHCILEDCVIRWADFAGLLVTGPAVVRRNVISHCGNSGIHITGVRNVLLADNVTNFNNWRQFEPGWHAGGMKITGSHHITVRRHVAAYNKATGIWFDIDCSHITVEHCITRANAGAGIHYEISFAPAYIRHNLSVDDLDMSIWISGSCGAIVEQNTCVGSNQGIVVNGVPRESYRLTDNVVRRNVTAHTGAALMILMKPQDDLVARNRSDDNLFWPGADRMPVFRTDWGAALTGLDVWQQLDGRDTHSRVLPLRFRNEQTGDYRLMDAPLQRYGADRRRLPDWRLTEQQ